MSERKVLTKYYPPDFDPAQLTRKKKGPKPTGPRVQPVRLMAPFSMKCTSCGEYIYKGRKFNARKETPEDERYLGVQIYRFYIRCTRCSSEITFKTDPKNQDYTCERGAKRSTEPWRRGVDEDETDEQRLDRLEREEEEAEERSAMEQLEAKTVDAKREMAVADALDEIRTRNARLERAHGDGLLGPEAVVKDEQKTKEDEEDAAAWARAQGLLEEAITEEVLEDGDEDGTTPSSSGSEIAPAPSVKRKAEEDNTTPAPTFKRQVKKKKEVLLPGIKKK
ncbi:DUF572-domain-containing protein [Cryphonectria parasitica EP155]|uniref:Splicing factor YJU2 n=1 Tax=Cryphonectria parasitica (strain ATCC 38755 / EP155) TaxID=660469 RepID=A0A9P5CTX7_CRYP1|nr:DUF572-domain-containing protein [Cryphonectria parasitica EP155]KAF3770808.1 DUF572-domain-containing protein [Cryphonectria parasitica EP155]